MRPRRSRGSPSSKKKKKSCGQLRSRSSCRRRKKSCSYSKKKKKCEPRKKSNPTRKLLNTTHKTLAKFGTDHRIPFTLTKRVIQSAGTSVETVSKTGRPMNPQLKITKSAEWMESLTKASDRDKLRSLPDGQGVFFLFMSQHQAAEIEIIRQEARGRSESVVYTDVSDSDSEYDE